jgi:hypothetical protein
MLVAPILAVLLTMATATTSQSAAPEWVFHRDGKQVGDYRDAGVPRSVAMKLSGHKTENVYRRYAIVSESDLAAGVQKIAALSGETGLAPRKVVSISEPISARTSTELTQSAEIERSTPGRSRGQVFGNSAANRFAEVSKGWRPQRDSNPLPRVGPFRSLSVERGFATA